MNDQPQFDDERMRRWRLILGGGSANGTGAELEETDLRADQALEALYDAAPTSGPGSGGLGGAGGLGESAPYVARWLGDIRDCFPSSAVQLLQKDALVKLNVSQLLLEPEFLESVTPNVDLAATLLALHSLLPARSRESARLLVRKVVDDLERRLGATTRQAVLGALNRAERTRKPRHSAIDWHQTIRQNLKHYQPAYRTIIPERLVGYAQRRNHALPRRTLILCIDQSSSMATSIVYAGVFGAVLASLPALQTHVIAFDTAVVDLTDRLDDPVEVLFGTQLGGGTNIHNALSYCNTRISQPQETILILISDLYEGKKADGMLHTVERILAAGAQMICLLALNDEGRPAFHAKNAAEFSRRGIPTFACTPDRFPDLMAAAIQRQDLKEWLASIS